jgi:hypothetical protein
MKCSGLGDRKRLGLMSPRPMAFSTPGASDGWSVQLDRDHRLDVVDPDGLVAVGTTTLES